MIPHRVAIQAAFWLTMFGLSSAFAFDPFVIDVKGDTPQARTSKIDHLMPLDKLFRSPPESNYLAQYWAQVSTELYRYLIVFRSDSNRYYVAEGDVPRHKVQPEKYRYKHKAEISVDTAQLIYEYWVNMLLETRYSFQQLPHMPPATIYTFSTSIPGTGWLHGYTLFPGVSPDLPPYWLAQAGEDLYAFVAKSPHDEKDLADKIKAHRDKFYQYMKAHACP
jgi:hypothetical protein